MKVPPPPPTSSHGAKPHIRVIIWNNAINLSCKMEFMLTVIYLLQIPNSHWKLKFNEINWFVNANRCETVREHFADRLFFYICSCPRTCTLNKHLIGCDCMSCSAADSHFTRTAKLLVVCLMATTNVQQLLTRQSKDIRRGNTMQAWGNGEGLLGLVEVNCKVR